MRIALIVDNPSRDLTGLVLTAQYLCDAGATCFLVPMNLWGREIWDLAPDFVLVNYLRDVNQHLVEQLLDCGIGVGVLDTEGGVFGELELYGLVSNAAPEVQGRVARVLCWGPRLAEWLIAQGRYRSDQVRVTGQPRFDLYKPAWREVCRRGSIASARYTQPLILINCSFAFANPRFNTPEQEFQAWLETGSHPREVVERWQSDQAHALEEMAALANELARLHPDVTFVLRPHPFERLSTYTERLASLPNLHLVQEGTVDGWISRSSAVIHCACSTAIEACLAGVPALHTAWIPMLDAMDVPISVSIACASPMEVSSRVEEAIAERLQVPEETERTIKRVERDWFHNDDGQAHARVGREILSALAEQDNRKRSQRARIEACQRVARGIPPGLPWPARAVRHLRSRLFTPEATPPPETLKVLEKRFYPEDVRAWLELVSACGHAGTGASCAVEWAADAGMYRFGFRDGRSVVVWSADRAPD